MNGFFSTLFEFLNREKNPYLILRNYENLPEKPLEGSDIDLLIDKKDEKKYSAVLRNAVLTSGAFILFKIRQSNCLSYFIYQKKPFPLGTWIDAFWEISTKGFNFADGKNLLKNRLWHKKGFFIPSPGGEAATLFLKEIFSQKFIKERYRLKIPSLVKKDKENFIKTLEPYFDQKTIQEMLHICFNGKWEEAFKKKKFWLMKLILNNLLKEPIVQIVKFLNFAFSQMKKFFTRKGLFIVIMGPDGVGKTTVCEGLKEKMRKIFFKKILYYHSHFGFFPELGKIYSFIFKKKFSEDSIRQEKPVGLARTLLYLFYYGFENFLAWPYFIFLKIRGDLIIFDRYFYDFISASANRKIPFLFFSFFAKLTPPPDILFILQAKPETIYQRKKDLSLNEIKKQLDAFQKLLILKVVPTIFVDSEKKPNEILNKIEDETLRFLSKRYGEK